MTGIVGMTAITVGVTVGAMGVGMIAGGAKWI